jgi:hypothetical protein
MFIPLFKELQACKFGAIGITRLYKELLIKLKEIKARFAIKLN